MTHGVNSQYTLLAFSMEVGTLVARASLFLSLLPFLTMLGTF